MSLRGAATHRRPWDSRFEHREQSGPLRGAPGGEGMFSQEATHRA